MIVPLIKKTRQCAITYWPSTLILNLHIFLFRVMFLVSCRCLVFLITSPILLRLTSFSPQAHHSEALTSSHWTYGHLLITCPNHLSLASLILSTMEATAILSWIYSFLILSHLVCPQIHLNILISTTSKHWQAKKYMYILVLMKLETSIFISLNFQWRHKTASSFLYESSIFFRS